MQVPADLAHARAVRHHQTRRGRAWLGSKTRREWARNGKALRDLGFSLGGLTRLTKGLSESDLQAPQSVLCPPARLPWFVVAGAAAMWLRPFDIHLPFLRVIENIVGSVSPAGSSITGPGGG